MKALVVLIVFSLFWIIFAILRERKEQQNAYIAAKKRDEDSISSSLRKIRYCVTYDLRTIKWRRSLISAGIVSFMLFALVWRRLPSSAEFATHMLIITAVFSIVWTNFSYTTGKDAAFYVDNNIKHIKKLLINNRSFILPNWD
jgi:uncharacterized BrkB/YihY/UPF0761 family membrane protein